MIKHESAAFEPLRIDFGGTWATFHKDTITPGWVGVKLSLRVGETRPRDLLFCDCLLLDDFGRRIRNSSADQRCKRTMQERFEIVCS